MSKTNNGGPAFPQPEQAHPNQPDPSAKHLQGMTLRDWFAGMALSATNPDDLSYGTLGQPRNPWPDVAADCYRAADAMLAEREREGK